MQASSTLYRLNDHQNCSRITACASINTTTVVLSRGSTQVTCSLETRPLPSAAFSSYGINTRRGREGLGIYYIIILLY